MRKFIIVGASENPLVFRWTVVGIAQNILDRLFAELVNLFAHCLKVSPYLIKNDRFLRS